MDLALEWQAEQDATCPGCGLSLDETTNQDNEDRYDTRVITCLACEAKDKRIRSWNGSMAGVMVLPYLEPAGGVGPRG